MESLSWFGKHNFPIILLVVLTFGACKKSKITPESKPEPPSIGPNTKQTPTTNRTELTNDSLFLYAKQVYYWNSSLPSYDAFEPRQYGIDYDGNLFNIAKSSGSADYIEGASFPKYSYIEDITNRNPEPIAASSMSKMSVDLEGNGNDIGILWMPYGVTSATQKYLIFVNAVYPGSDAESKGVKRGWAITHINEESFGTNTWSDTEYRRIEAQLDKGSVIIEGFVYTNDVQGEPFTVILNKKSYKSTPIYNANIINSGNRKIGYLAYARFSDAENSNTALESEFTKFSAGGVTDLVIDLRYNGGGYISTAERLVNYIAPISAQGVMYKEYYNADMQNKRALILKNQPVTDENGVILYNQETKVMLNYYDDYDYSVKGNTFNFNKIGNLTGITNIVFLVTRNTASASELVINALQPKMSVTLVGSTTYGKPIGFFPLRMENKYDVYYAMFETKNSLDQGGYFNGMSPSPQHTEYDNPTYQLGDAKEPMLAKAISVLNPVAASTSVARTTTMSINGKRGTVNPQSIFVPVEQSKTFVGMIEDRFRRK